mmetsp:Transcript_15364/g.36633  ORF Transcript_15364/g.36633 Transcript_15364/m.36633 type:complete len:206 (-) Transcript_15364:923-1540(-)
MRRRRTRSRAARAGPVPLYGRLFRRRRRRNLRQPWLRPEQGPPGRLGTRPRHEERASSGVDGHQSRRRGRVRPPGHRRPRQEPGRQHQGQLGQLPPWSGMRGHRRPRRPHWQPPRDQGRGHWQGLHGQGHHSGPWICALRSPRRHRRRKDRLHLRRRTRAAVRPRVGRHHWLGIHRPGILRRLHRPRIRGHLRRGPPHAHAHLRS